jgi:hypothetical protein
MHARILTSIPHQSQNGQEVLEKVGKMYGALENGYAP